jgi:hypothetical protein
MKFTLGTAAQATGNGKTTIHTAIKTGKLSATRNENGSYEIDASELFRVYDPVKNVPQEQVLEQSRTPDGTEILNKEIESLKQQLERERFFVAELSKRLDDETSERKKLTLLLTHQTEMKEAKEKKTGNLWNKIFKKR